MWIHIYFSKPEQCYTCTHARLCVCWLKCEVHLFHSPSGTTIFKGWQLKLDLPWLMPTPRGGVAPTAFVMVWSFIGFSWASLHLVSILLLNTSIWWVGGWVGVFTIHRCPRKSPGSLSIRCCYQILKATYSKLTLVATAFSAPMQ